MSYIKKIDDVQYITTNKKGPKASFSYNVNSDKWVMTEPASLHSSAIIVFGDVYYDHIFEKYIFQPNHETGFTKGSLLALIEMIEILEQREAVKEK